MNGFRRYFDERKNILFYVYFIDGVDKLFYADGSGSITGKEGDFSLLDSAHTGSEGHRAFYPMGTGHTFPGGKSTGARN
jgi:hypothetical protein